MKIPTRFQLNSTAYRAYWTEEHGRELLADLPCIPEKQEASQHVPWLWEVDELADDVITELFTNIGFTEGMKQVKTYLLHPFNAPQSLQKLFHQMMDTPDWVNPELIQKGYELCNRSGKSGLIVLRNYSLMLGYQSAAINKPLVATGALQQGAVKRIANTTNFWFAVTAPQLPTPASKAFEYLVQTRIIHAYSRQQLLQSGNWDCQELGKPLNQWDMVATYLGFSLVFYLGLEKLGFSVSKQEREGTLALWQYYGHLLGIPHTYMPTNHNDAVKALYLWSCTQPPIDADSIALAQALHHEPMLAKFPKIQLGKKFIQEVNLGFNYMLMGTKSSELLQLPNSSFRYWNQSVILSNQLEETWRSKHPSFLQTQIKNGRKAQHIINEQVRLSR